MKILITAAGRDVVDVELHVWRKRKPPSAAPAPKDEGPVLRASGHLQSSERGREMQPDTRTFGFGRR